jgi:6-pyruvoyltetrahydropterin/6-carboxytetrahydropterin synthase
VFQITVESTFTAAHALCLADGAMEPMHGHDWRVAVTVQSPQLDAMDCVMDFHQLQHAVDRITDPWRNRVLNQVPPFVKQGGVGGPEGMGELAINPSAERVAEVIARGVGDALPQGVELVSVQVGEAPGCRAILLYLHPH